MTDSKHAVGVDWASGCWLAVEYKDDNYHRVRAKKSFECLWTSFGEKPDQLLVDVPIGLFDEGDEDEDERGRECDTLARRVLGSRSSSVFTPPARQAARAAVDGKPHSEVSEINREIVDKGLSIQAYHIAAGIAEIDEFLTPDDEEERRQRRKRIEEAHPEVCFVAFAEEEITYSKKSAVGLGERLAALENVVDDPGETFRDICRQLQTETEDVDLEDVDPADINPDDVLDALALAISAGADENDRQTLPEGEQTDYHDLPMQMVYRADEPL